MKIVIDLRIFGPKFGGLGRYNQKLLEYFIKSSDNYKDEYILLFKSKPANLSLPDNFKIKICSCHWYTLKEQIVLPYVLKKLKPDLVHFTHFNVPLFYNGKFIVTIHDLIMSRFPSRGASTLNRFLFILKHWFYNKVISRAVHKSLAIIAVSKFTRNDIKEFFKLTDQESQKIKIIYEGLTKPVFSDTKIDLPEKFLFYAGNAYPHKNLEFLIDSFQEFLKDFPNFYLILAGRNDYFYQRLQKRQNNKHVIFAGFIDDRALAFYYSKASVYVFPSHYEGFGLPPLEAMFYNLPVLSSSSSCLPEILGDAALYFKNNDSNDFVDKLKLIVSNNELREQLKRKGQEQVKKYSWATMAKEILKLYKKY